MFFEDKNIKPSKKNDVLIKKKSVVSVINKKIKKEIEMKTNSKELNGLSLHVQRR